MPFTPKEMLTRLYEDLVQARSDAAFYYKGNSVFTPLECTQLLKLRLQLDKAVGRAAFLRIGRRGDPE